MKINFGVARSLYEANIHPRLFHGPEEVDALKALIRSAGPAKILFKAIRERVTPYADNVLAADNVPAHIADRERRGSYGGELCVSLHDMALVGVLAEDERFVEATCRVLNHLPQAEPLFNYDIFVHGRNMHAMFAFDLLYDRLTSEQRQAFAEWALEQHIRKIIRDRLPTYYKQPAHNLTYGKVLSAIHTLLAIQGAPGLPSLDEELAQLLHMYEATLNVAICPDGYPEEDGGYGTHFLCFINLVADALYRAGVFDAVGNYPRLAKSGRAVLHMIEPWGTHLVTTGDCGSTFGLNRQYVLPSLARRTQDPALLWFNGVIRDNRKEVEITPGYTVPAEALSLLNLDLLDEPVHPADAGVPTQSVIRRRGLVFFRSGWHAEATQVIFDGSQRSPGGQGHAHASCGHFDLNALGEIFAIDTGRYNMEQDQHNLVLVDGKSGRSNDGNWIQMFHDGLLTDYLPGDFVDFAAVDASHQYDCRWGKRNLGLVNGEGAPAYVWTVEDVNKSDALAEYWWTLNTSPKNSIEINGERAILHGYRHGNMLDIAFVLPGPAQGPKPHTLALAHDIKTCGSFRYVSDPDKEMGIYEQPEDAVHHSAFVRPRFIARITGDVGRFMSVMIPRRKGEEPAMVEQIDSLDNSLAVKITFPTVEDVIVFAYEHQQLIAGDIRGCGQWCVVRRSRRTGDVLQYALGHGARLQVAGQQLVCDPGAEAEPVLRGGCPA